MWSVVSKAADSSRRVKALTDSLAILRREEVFKLKKTYASVLDINKSDSKLNSNSNKNFFIYFDFQNYTITW